MRREMRRNYYLVPRTIVIQVAAHQLMAGTVIIKDEDNNADAKQHLPFDEEDAEMQLWNVTPWKTDL